MSKKILITGGHLSPAYAIIKKLIQKKISLVFVGRKHAFSDNSDLSLEYRLLYKQDKLKFYTLKSGRFTKGHYWKWPIELVLFFFALIKSFYLLHLEKPDTIISFGGYLSLPICLAAYVMKIPIYLHEQTVAPGMANKILAHIAKKVFVAFPNSLKYFPKTKTELIGLPLRSEIITSINKPSWFASESKPLILVLGGSSGSHSINQIIAKNLNTLKTKYQVVHQTGENKYQDFEKLVKSADSSYFPVKFILPKQIGYFYKQADLIISRSGANTFFELIYFQKPAVLIPLPWSAANEQGLQAQVLKKAGVAEVFIQTKQSSNFIKKVDTIINNKLKYKKNYQNLNNYAKLIIRPEQLVKKIIL